MDSDAATIIGPSLLAGERIIWCGRPRDLAALRWRAVVIVFLAVAALFLRAQHRESALGDRIAANAIGLAVAVVALIAEAMVFHSYLVTTFYGVTNRRVIVVSGLRSREVEEIPLERINRSKLKVRRIRSNVVISPARGAGVREAGYFPFTNPSVPPRWGSVAEVYRLVALTEAGRVYSAILDAAHPPG